MITGLKDPKSVIVGDTLTTVANPTKRPLACYQEPQSNKEDEKLKAGIEKLGLNDPSFQFQPTQSEAMGVGFNCGFLGIFHL